MKHPLLIVLLVFSLLSFTPVKGKRQPKPRPTAPRTSCKYGDGNKNIRQEQTELKLQQHTQKKNNINSLLHVQKLKIGIILLYGRSAAGGWDEDIMKKVLHNRYSYASHHGYDVINCNDLIDRTRPVAWSKFLALLHYLLFYDYMMYIDMDVVIMQPSITIESLIFATEKSADADLILQADWNGLNTGIFLAKNTTWTRDFLQLAWNQKQLVRKKAGAVIRTIS